MKKKILLLPLCMLIICFSSKAQTFYELNYISPANQHISPITAFLVRFSDGNGYVRVKYFDSTEKKEVVMNMDIADLIPEKSVTGSMPDTFMVLVSNPKTIIPLKEMSFIPDHYLFRIDPATGFSEPWKVVSSADTQKTDFTNTPVIIQTAEITTRYLQTFFRKDEPFFQFILGADNRDLNNLPGKGITMHLIIVADIGDASIGTDCTKDYQNLLSTYAKIAAQIGVRLDTLTVMGKRYSKQNVEKALKNLHPASNDIVIFHYTGHGFNNGIPDKKFPNIFLQTSKKYKTKDLPKISLNIEDIYQTIVQKGARLNFVFSDCCNNTITSKQKKSPPIDPNRSGILDINPEKCKTLFIDQTASVLATAAQKEELSRSNENDGGYFTSNYVLQLNELLSPVFNPYVKITWDGILNKTKEVTLQKLRRCFDEDAINCKCVMNPLFVITPAKTN